MPSCERCWADAGGNIEIYKYLLDERTCTPEQQAGPDARRCPVCERNTVHQHAGVCMACYWIEAPDA